LKPLDRFSEVASGCMDGPFSCTEVTRILRGPFRSSPLVIAVQLQAPGEPDKIRICWHLSKAKKSILSVDSFIKTTDFPMCFDTAARIVELVSLSSLLFFFHPYVIPDLSAHSLGLCFHTPSIFAL
jgi:hypothetical protein